MDEAMRYENGLRIGRAWVDSARAAKSADAAPREEAAPDLSSEAFPWSPDAPDLTAASPEAAPAQARSSGETVAARVSAVQPGPVTGSLQMTDAAVLPVEQQMGVPQLAPMRGITVGPVNAPPVGPPTALVQRSIRRQIIAAAMCVVALVPPLAVALLLGLSHRAHAIPGAAVWAWMAALLALGATTRSAIFAIGRDAVAWLSPVMLSVLLLVPAGIVLYLRLTLVPVPTRLAVAQMALYGATLVALLLSAPRETAE